MTDSSTKTKKGSENKALDPSLKRCDVEVDQQTRLGASHLHVGQQLRLVNSLSILRVLRGKIALVILPCEL
jgi:hypothetical protein